MVLAATLLVLSLSAPLLRANPVGWPPIAPVNVPGRRFSPFASASHTFQSYPVSISVIPPGNDAGFKQQDDPFSSMGGQQQQQQQQFMPPGFGAMGQMGPINPMYQLNQMPSSMNQMSQGFGQSPFHAARAPSPFGPPQMGNSNSILGSMGAQPQFQFSQGAPAAQQAGEQTTPMPQQPQEPAAGAPMMPTATMGQPKLPPFLEGTSKSVQDRFFEIVQNRSDPYMDKQKKLDELINELDDAHKTQYQQYIESKAKEEEENRQKVHAIVATMSDDAQAQFAKKVQQVYDAMSTQLKEEFEAKFTAYG